MWTYELFHRDARLMPRRAKVGGHMNTRYSVIGPFQMFDPEMTYGGQDECLHFQASLQPSALEIITV